PRPLAQMGQLGAQAAQRVLAAGDLDRGVFEALAQGLALGSGRLFGLELGRQAGLGLGDLDLQRVPPLTGRGDLLMAALDPAAGLSLGLLGPRRGLPEAQPLLVPCTPRDPQLGDATLAAR